MMTDNSNFQFFQTGDQQQHAHPQLSPLAANAIQPQSITQHLLMQKQFSPPLLPPPPLNPSQHRQINQQLSIKEEIQLDESSDAEPDDYHVPILLHQSIQPHQQQQNHQPLIIQPTQKQPTQQQQQQQQQNYRNVFGRLSYKDDVLFISENIVEIGRNSSTSSVHFHVGKNSFVSRKHLQMLHDLNNGDFYLICLSKNGVFVDDVFQRKSSEPLKLTKSCTFRFPSTNIRISFESFIDQPFETNKNNKIVETANVIYSPLKITIPETEKKSPFPSPTGTISAANSCPTSPRQGFQDYHAYNYNNNNNFQNDLFQPPSTSSYNDYEKPPYSYAQLIVQSISASPEKQLTLSGIYSFISKHYPYYRKEANKGWQNSIRHNLSLNRYFIKVARSQDEPGKGSFWRIDPNSEAKLIDQSYKKRRQRGSQCFRTPYGMPRSAPVSPSHIDNSRDNSPLHDIVLQSAPGSPGVSYHHNDNHSNEEVIGYGSSQLLHQSAYNSSNQYNSQYVSPNSTTIIKRQHVDLYDDQQDAGDDSDEYETTKRHKYQDIK